MPSSVVLDTKILLAEVPKMANTITTPAIINMIANFAGVCKTHIQIIMKKVFIILMFNWSEFSEMVTSWIN